MQVSLELCYYEHQLLLRFRVLFIRLFWQSVNCLISSTYERPLFLSMAMKLFYIISNLNYRNSVIDMSVIPLTMHTTCTTFAYCLFPLSKRQASNAFWHTDCLDFAPGDLWSSFLSFLYQFQINHSSTWRNENVCISESRLTVPRRIINAFLANISISTVNIKICF